MNNFIPMVEEFGKRVKIFIVHFGGGVSGHIQLVPRFLDWVEQGYKVYADTTWAIGFGPRWLLTEIERRGVGQDRVLFASDEPWSDFWGEYHKIAGVNVEPGAQGARPARQLRGAVRDRLNGADRCCRQVRTTGRRRARRGHIGRNVVRAEPIRRAMREQPWPTSHPDNTCPRRPASL